VVIGEVGCAACEDTHSCRITVAQETPASPRVWELANRMEYLDADSVPEDCWRSIATAERFESMIEELDTVEPAESNEQRHHRDFIVLKRCMEFFTSSYEIAPLSIPRPSKRRILARAESDDEAAEL